MTTYADQLRVLPQFRPDEFDELRRVLFGRLEHRLAHWRPDQVALELSVKDRGGRSQRTVLECRLPGRPKLVAISSAPDLNRAVAEVRDDLWDQIDKYVTKDSPRRR